MPQRSIDERNQLVTANLRFARWAARRLAGWLEEIDPDWFDDVLQAARLGLVDAAEHWDERRGTFATCAYFWIRRRVVQCLRGRDLVRVPGHFGGEARRAAQVTVGGLPQGHDEAHPFDVVPDDRAGPLTQAEADELADQVHASLRCLSQRSRRVLERRFGLGGGEPATLSEVGAELGVMRERVRQVQAEALEDLARRAPQLAEHLAG